MGYSSISYDQMSNTVVWSLLALGHILFAAVWFRSFLVRTHYRSWETSIVIAVVFFLLGLSRIFDMLSVWYPVMDVHLLLEGCAGIIFITWIINQIREKTIPVFLRKKDVDEMDIQHYEKIQHAARIKHMLVTRESESPESNDESYTI